MSDATIKLNFINKSNSKNNLSVVLFQKNLLAESPETIIAWKVIQNCGLFDHHPFDFPLGLTISMEDSYGNFSPQLPANAGDTFQMITNASGNQLVNTGNNNLPEIDARNGLAMGSLNVNIYRAGKLLAQQKDVVPNQMVAFDFNPMLFIGVVPYAQEGDVIKNNYVINVYTQISLMGISQADIIMTGGGIGPSATAYSFSLDNIVY